MANGNSTLRGNRFKDLAGITFGRWTAISPVETNGQTRTYWHCRCRCGTESNVLQQNLQNGASQSCGCLYRERLSSRPQCGANVVDRTGDRYGRLVVMRREGSKGTSATWCCQCDCGKTCIVSSNSLRGGYTKSCGCSRRTGKGSRPAYHSKHPRGASAKNAILKQYRYAAKKRGLEWALLTHEFFIIVKKPCHYCGRSPARTVKVSGNGEFLCNGIDRIDNVSGYTPANCVPCCSVCNHAKATMTFGDFRDWITEAYNHLAKRGWSIERALTEPVKAKS